jgi:hypothetical protein
MKRPKKGEYSGRIVYGPMHRNPSDKGFPYYFVSAAQLISDFFEKIDEVIVQREKRSFK